MSRVTVISANDNENDNERISLTNMDGSDNNKYLISEFAFACALKFDE